MEQEWSGKGEKARKYKDLCDVSEYLRCRALKCRGYWGYSDEEHERPQKKFDLGIDAELVMIYEEAKARRAFLANILEITYKLLVLETRREEREEARAQRIEELDTRRILVEKIRMVLDQNHAEGEEHEYQNA